MRDWKVFLLLACALSAASYGGEQPLVRYTGGPERELEEQALGIARSDPRVKDILLDIPEVRLGAEYSDEYGVWIVSLSSDDRLLGHASVSLEQRRVVEFNVRISEEPEARGRDERDEDQPDLRSVFSRFRPRFEGPSVAWISLVIVVLLAGDFGRPLSLRNLDIVLLYMLCPFLNVLWANTKLAFTGIFCVTVLFFLRSILGVRIRTIAAKLNHGTKRAIFFVLILVCLFHVQTVYEKGIEDCGIWSVIGADYMRESGHLPYGTAFGSNCVYGPLMYLVHIPGNMLFRPEVSFDSEGGVEWGEYGGFEMRGAQCTLLLFDLLAMLGLYLFGRRYGGGSTGLLLALVYAISPYVLGLGTAMGLQQSSHITGIAFVVFALVLLARPVLAGLLLGMGCGLLYYPVFLVPLWLGYYWRVGGRKDALKFLAAIAVVGIACLVMILTLTVPDESHRGMSALGAFVNDTIYQQQFKEGYGTSKFGFWGQYPELMAWAKPTVGVCYLLFCLSLGLLPRRIDVGGLVALSAAILVGTQLVLSHGGGTYIGFYIAPFIIVLFTPLRSQESTVQCAQITPAQ